jgi:hypothetical protein
MGVLDGRVATNGQILNTVHYAQEIIKDLSPKAFQELLGGYDNDLDNMLDSILNETHSILHLGQTQLKSENLGYLHELEASIHEELKRKNYNYFKTACLPNFDQHWRNIEWGNLIMQFPFLALLACRGSGKSYEFSYSFPLWKLYKYRRPGIGQNSTDNIVSKEGVLMCNTLKLARKLCSKVKEEIDVNDTLGAVMRDGPSTGFSIGVEKIRTANGSILELRSADNSIRGLHPGWIVVDDFLDKGVIYSKERRDKLTNESFNAEIMPALEPNGQVVTVGTPFTPDDLYGSLRGDGRFKLFEYPAIFPDGTLLAPDRITLEKLLMEREALGSMVFPREYLITPISDTSSIFPWEYLEKSFVGMEKISYVENIESFPIKMKRVVMACDLARSGAIGADYCAYMVVGICPQNNIYVMNVWHKKGVSHDEMVNQMVSMNQRFKPRRIYVEDNGFQNVIGELAKQRGLKNIELFTSTGQKKDLLQGFPALGASFERGDIRMPCAHGVSKDMTMMICSELNSIAFDDSKGKLQAAGSGHDDLAHVLFFAWYKLMFGTKTASSFTVG